jgi:membrane protein DedA with SNARE-associated domain
MSVSHLLEDYKYLAMFGILFLCGLGLPIPEEVTLILSGVLVGFGQANFWVASLVCVSAILAGDSMIFFLGRYLGRSFLKSRVMRWMLTRKRQARVRALFSRHGTKAVFMARFFAGVRIGVYAYAGQSGMAWYKFAFLDLLGALISGPTSIWLGKFAAERFADTPEEAAEKALRIVHDFKVWIYAGLLLSAAGLVLYLYRKRRRRGNGPVEITPGAAPAE